MRIWQALIATLLVFWLRPDQAAATTIIQERLPCPVGGEIYTQWFRPETRLEHDRQLDSGFLPSPMNLNLDMCENGLVLYKAQFSAAELDRLPELIVQPSYKKLPRSPSYIRAMWLSSRLGADQFERTRLLGRAASEMSLERYETEPYLQAYLLALAQLPWSASRSRDWLRAYVHGANQLRMAGNFKEAYQLLTALSNPVLLPQTSDRLEAARIIRALRQISAEHVDDLFPVTLAKGVDEAADICSWTNRPLGASERKICSSVRVRELVTLHCWRDVHEGILHKKWGDCLKNAPITLAISPLALFLALILLVAMFRSFASYDRKGLPT